MEIFKLVGSIFVDSSKAEQSIAKTDSKAQKIGKTLLGGVKTAGKWGAAIVAGAAAAATAVAGLATATVSSYADYEQLTGGVETLFKDSADVVEGYAKRAYKTAGMTANQYMETVTSFSASLLQGLNGDTAKAAEVADMAITDMSDNANKMGTDMQSIQNAYQGFAKQNYTMLDNLKLGYGGTKSEMKRLLADAEKISGVKYNIENLNDVYEAIHIIQGEMGITGTTALEATTTISGAIGMLRAKFSDFKTDIGAAIAPVVKSFLTMAIDNLPVIQSLIESSVPVVSDLMQTLLPPAMQLVQTVFPLLISLITALLPPVTQILESVLPIIILLLDTLLPPFIQIVEMLLPPLLSMLQPLIALLAPIIELLQPILSLAVALLQPLAELISNILTPMISVVTDVIGSALTPLKTVLSGLIDFIAGIFTGNWRKAWEGVKSIFSGIWEGIKTAFKAPINWIIDGINLFIRGINKIEIPDWVPIVGGKGLSIREIPRLQAGGVLEKGQTGFLEGNGAEAVVPLHENRKWINAVADDMDRAMGAGASGEKVLAALLRMVELLEQLTGMKIYLYPETLVGELAGPMDERLGKIRAQKERG